MRTIRIGSGAGFGGDRIEPALAVMEHGQIDSIIFECLAERTIALAQQHKATRPEKGYNELLEYRMTPVLPLCVEKQIKVITNMGAANPVASKPGLPRLCMGRLFVMNCPT
jgi:Acyclic terpene utilisation family protein AtuA